MFRNLHFLRRPYYPRIKLSIRLVFCHGSVRKEQAMRQAIRKNDSTHEVTDFGYQIFLFSNQKLLPNCSKPL